LNPDGSEAEKSGNGLHIFARYLWDKKMVWNDPFTVETAGGEVSCVVFFSVPTPKQAQQYDHLLNQIFAFQIVQMFSL